MHNISYLLSWNTVNQSIVQWTFIQHCKCCEANTKNPFTLGKSNAGHSKDYTYWKHCTWKELPNPWKHGVLPLREGPRRDSNFYHMPSYCVVQEFKTFSLKLILYCHLQFPQKALPDLMFPFPSRSCGTPLGLKHLKPGNNKDRPFHN